MREKVAAAAIETPVIAAKTALPATVATPRQPGNRRKARLQSA